MDPTRTTGPAAPAPEPVSACIVVTGGDALDPSVRRLLPEGAVVVGVDSGIGHALALGLHIDVAVGDFDSVAPGALAAVEAEGARVERHPRAKDATDLELGLSTAVASGARRVIVLGGHGGRLDHLLANALLLAAEPFRDVVVEAHMGAAWVGVARPGGLTRIAGGVGAIVSLLPVGGPATGVTTTGLAYPLDGEVLGAGTTRGVSNLVSDEPAAVELDGGTLLVVRPGGVA